MRPSPKLLVVAIVIPGGGGPGERGCPAGSLRQRARQGLSPK
jgi:hypothetical protein